MSPHAKWAFTLVELLVVIAIIVVLLSVLAPAMDRVVYHAEMIRCAANMKGTATAVNVYAAEHGRTYPWRQYSDTRSFNLAGTFVGGQPLDTRPRLAPYLSINKNLQDPFIAQPADISIEGSPASSHTYSSYWLWFGWPLDSRYHWLKKLGDRMQWVDSGLDQRFDVMISDGQAIHVVSNFWIQAGHPDHDARLINQRLQNAVVTWPGFATYSLWALNDVTPRITMDCNYLHTDGSATRLDDLTFETASQKHDERLGQVPERVNDGDATLRNFLPR